LHGVHPLGDLPEHGVHAVQVPRVLLAQHDEELAAAGVLPRVRHRERALHVRARVPRRLALDVPPRAAGADLRMSRRQIARQGIAPLHDEILDDAMELHAIVELAVRELLEVRDGARRIRVVELGGDGAAVGFEGSGLHGRVTERRTTYTADGKLTRRSNERW